MIEWNCDDSMILLDEVTEFLDKRNRLFSAKRRISITKVFQGMLSLLEGLEYTVTKPNHRGLCGSSFYYQVLSWSKGYSFLLPLLGTSWCNGVQSLAKALCIFNWASSTAFGLAHGSFSLQPICSVSAFSPLVSLRDRSSVRSPVRPKFHYIITHLSA